MSRLRRLFERLPFAAQRQGRKMAETTPAAPSAGGIDPKALQDAIAAGVAAAVKPLQDKITAMETAAATKAKPEPAAPAATEKALSAADVQKAIADAIAADRQSAEASAARAAFIADKMKDLPAAYQRQLGNDPAAWAAKEQEIRTAYQADFKASGGTVPDKGGADAGGQKPADTLDLSKATPMQLATMALQTSKPVGQAAPK